jgi:hypothetical protein
MLLLLVFVLVFYFVGVNGTTNVFAKEQYVTVLRAEDYVQPNGRANDQPSVYIGLLHIAVIDNTTQIQTTLWHNVANPAYFYLNGPAAAGSIPSNHSALPLLMLASSHALDPANCPIQGTFTVSPRILLLLRTNMLYAEIDVVGSDSVGNIRGQIYFRDDALVGFMPNVPGQFSADNGMAVLRAHEAGILNGVQYVYLDFWFLSVYTAGQFISIAGGADLSTQVLFGAIPSGQTTSVTLLIAQPMLGPVVPFSTAFTGSPLVGPGSSGMELALQQTQTLIIFSQFVRMSDLQDDAVFASNGTASTGAPSVVRAEAYLLPMITIIVSLVMIVINTYL